MEIQHKTSPKDVFLHLLAIVTLYASAIGFLIAVFNYVDLNYPASMEYYYEEGMRDTIRWSLSMLIVMFPVYVGTMWFLNKSYAKEPARRDMRVRKWLVYLTLFIAAIVIIIDLITLIYNLLGGEYTGQFFLKVVAVFFVAASIFGYYLWDVKKYKTE